MKTLQNLSIAYRVFSEVEPAKTRTFNALAQKHLWDMFSARGIYAAYKMDYYKFMKEWVKPTSDVNAVKLFTEEKVEGFLEALEIEIESDPQLVKMLKSIKNAPAVKLQVTEAIEEIKEEAAPVVSDFEQAIADAVVEEPVAEPAPQPVKPEATKPNKAGNVKANFNLDLGSIISMAVEQYMADNKVNAELDEEAVAKIVEAKIANIKPIEVHIKGAKPVVLTGRLHKKFQETLSLITIERQGFLSGPAGTGKTTLASQVAEALQLPFGHISCTAGMSEAHLLGRMIADGSYIMSQFVDLYENGGVFLFDEVDAADSNTMLIINSALANGYMSIPNRRDNPVAKRHENFYAVCAANTWGSGSNEYVGRGALDAAFLDRFVGCKVAVDYDVELEAEALNGHDALATALWRIRENVTKHRVRRVVSSRAFASASRHLSAGRSKEQFMETFFTGWSKEEINKATDTN